MKQLFQIFLFLGAIHGFAQERLAPLRGNMNLMSVAPRQFTPSHSAEKTTAVNDTITLPFFEDFHYAPESPFPTSKYWIDSSVYVNTGFAIAPLSIGVATFDGLNKKGYPYNISANEFSSASADYLTSKPVNLFSSGSSFYVPADSIGFSFFYQSAGFGENPESNDSLVLEFYKPLYANTTGTNTTYGCWVQAWGTRGVNNPTPLDSTFKKAFVFITDTAFFHEGFKFRFRNKATSSGSLDHWHIDYIYMDKLRSKLSDSTSVRYDDVSFAYVPRSFLKNYSAMPYRHYIPAEMGTNFSNFLRYNSYGTSQHSNEYRYTVYNPNGTKLFERNQGSLNIDPFKSDGYQNGAVHANPTLDTLFPPLTSSSTFKIKHVIKPVDSWAYNDTVVQYHVFDNYFAYDDGSAEVGYYLNNAPGGKIALRFTLNVVDTLHALDIFFDPIIQGHYITNPKLTSFRMCVWNSNGGVPGSLILRDSLMYPKYLDYGYNKMPRYNFTSPLILGPGTYFFGLQQTTTQHLNIGFDRNINHKSALYFDASGFWEPSAVDGSLMLHPIFGNSVTAIGISETQKEKADLFKLYPNPASSFCLVKINSGHTEHSVIEVYSTFGQKILEIATNDQITELPLDGLASGIYFVMLKQDHKLVSQQKLIISR
jgi:hypothetical protein